MKTNKEERAELKLHMGEGEVRRLIDDVEEATRLLGVLRRWRNGTRIHDHETGHLACEACDHWEIVDNFLKEPSG